MEDKSAQKRKDRGEKTQKQRRLSEADTSNTEERRHRNKGDSLKQTSNTTERHTSNTHKKNTSTTRQRNSN